MTDIAVRELNKYYGANHILKGLTFEIYSGEKVGLLGKNGSGKTTLFRILADMETFESGTVSKANGKKIEMLDQIPVFHENLIVEDIFRNSFREIANVHEEMKKIEGNGDPAALKKYGMLMEEYERLGGYETETKIEKVCAGMNIGGRMRQSLFSLLSGGEKTRVNLARILLRECDILLLDEPTNHLDLNSLEWLEKFLKDYRGTIVAVSHDRAFLDNIAERIIEIDDGKANFYEGNYSYYVEEKERRFLSASELYEQQQKKIRQLETAAKRLHEWGKLNPSNDGLHKRAFAIEKRIEQMDKVEKPVESKKITEEFNGAGFAGKEIVSFNNVNKAYGDKTIVNNMELKVYRNDSIALIGANGCGKSTLMKMIMGNESPDEGEIKAGLSTRIAYLPQIIDFGNNNATVLEILCLEIGSGEDKARNILAGFHFKGKDVFKKAGSLSGGEKSRLKLCLLMQTDANFLMLDEPTNHLDIESREWIEEAVADFNGTKLFISHDRYFLDKFAYKIWHMENGEVTEYNDTFEEYLKIRAQKEKESKNNIRTKKPPKSPLRLTAEQIESKISETEKKLKEITSGEEKLKLELFLDSLYNEWMKL